MINFRKVPAAGFHAFKELLSIHNNACFKHFTEQVVPFPCSFTHTGKNRQSRICFRNIVYKLKDHNSLSNTCTSKQAYFTSLGIWFNKVDNLDTGIENLLFS